jgi:hypothetical protein
VIPGRRVEREGRMRAMNFVRTVAVGAGLALAAMIPAVSQARETANETQATSAISLQTLKALNARWNAEAAGYKVLQSRLKALEGEWNVAPRRYGMH